MFYDLNVKRTSGNISNSVLEKTISQLDDYGYRAIALTVEVDETIFIQKKSKTKNKDENADTDIIPSPPDVRSLKEKFPKLNIYRRINVVLSESENIRKVVQSKNLKLYDLVSFQPENQNVLKSLTSVPEMDIISYNPENKSSLMINRKMYNQLIAQNVYFELMYVPALTSQSARRNLISLSHIYHAIGKSKNVIVSSGSHLSTHVRGPYDVINFNLLFGLSEEQAKKAISRNCENLILRARKQRRGKSMIEIEVMDNKVPKKEEEETETSMDADDQTSPMEVEDD